MKKPFYITTPIYYPSGNFHVGHCYTTVIADALSRRKRLKGHEVYFLTGSDEHGQKIEARAQAAKVSPKEFVDPIIENAKDLWKALNISYDRFIRTTDQDHIECVRKIMEKLYKQDDIYKGQYEGWYCTPCESFWSKTQLVNDKCPDCQREVKLTKEDAYFLRLSKYQSNLEKYLEKNRKLMQPESRYNEMLNNFLKPGLKDLCVSRSSVKWGIPCSFDENQTVYVWVDALSNYISALGYLSDDDSLMQKFWPADLHLVGKEIFRFHTIIWPIILMALKLELPTQVYGHGWLTIGGDKISKSKGNYKDPREFIKEYNEDTLRYYLLSEVPFGYDGLFSEELMVQRRNSDLCNVLGNLVNRTIVMTNKYFNGKVDKIKETLELDLEVIDYLNSLDKELDSHLDELNIPLALKSIFARLERLNKYIDETCPWILGKDESQKSRLNDVLYVILEGIRICAFHLSAFIPNTSLKIFSQLNTKQTTDETLLFGSCVCFEVTAKPVILFERIDEEKLKEKLNQEVEEEKQPEISFEDFMKTSLVVGEIVGCVKHEKADNLLVSKVDLGNKIVQIVSGIAKYYQPDEMLGKHVIVVANLKPIKLKGVLSSGMLLAGDDGKIVILETNLPKGTRIK